MEEPKKTEKEMKHEKEVCSILFGSPKQKEKADENIRKLEEVHDLIYSSNLTPLSILKEIRRVLKKGNN